MLLWNRRPAIRSRSTPISGRGLGRISYRSPGGTTSSLPIAALVFSLSACTARTGATPTSIPASLEAPSAVASSPTLPQPEAAATQPAPVGEPPASQAAEIPGAEGLILRGVFYPAPGPSAPGVLLLHMYR